MSFIRRYYPEIFSALAPIIVFWRLTFAGEVLYWGLPLLQFIPWRILVNDSFRAGTIPLWTSMLGMGAPLLANHQSAVFYPPNLLSLIINPENAISILAVLHLSFAGVGMVRVARRLGLQDFGAATVGVTFGLAQYLTARLWFISINNAIAWLPWIVLAADSLTSDLQHPISKLQFIIPTRRSLILTSLIALQLLAGHAQSSFYTLLIAATWLGWHSLKPKQDVYENHGVMARRRIELLIFNLFKFSVAVFFAICLTAIQIIPTYELLRQSPRADAAAYDFVMTYSFWPWRLTTLITPDIFGHPADGNYWGYATYWEDAIYQGIMPFMFFVYALITARRNRKIYRGDIVFLVALSIISIVFAFGNNTPIFPFFYRYVPFFNLFQAPARMLIGFTFAMSLLVGIGSEQWSRSDRKRYWSRLGIAGSILMTILGLLAKITFTDPRANTIAGAVAGVAALGIVAFILTLNQPAAPNRWHWIVVAFITVDLGIAAVRLNPTIDSSFYKKLPDVTLASRIYQYEKDEYKAKFSEFLTFKYFYSLDRQQIQSTLMPNLNILNHVESINNFDPLLTERYINFIKVMETNPRLLDLADARTLVKTMRVVLPRIDNKASRLRVVYQSQSVDSPQASLIAITNPTFDPDSQVILESPTDMQYGMRITSYQLPIAADRDGYVVVSDSYYPGWRVLVDGQPQKLLIADHLFRAVAVSQGQHVVTFEYAPLSFTLGLMVSILSIISFIVCYVVSTQLSKPSTK